MFSCQRTTEELHTREGRDSWVKVGARVGLGVCEGTEDLQFRIHSWQLLASAWPWLTFVTIQKGVCLYSVHVNRLGILLKCRFWLWDRARNSIFLRSSHSSDIHAADQGIALTTRLPSRKHPLDQLREEVLTIDYFLSKRQNDRQASHRKAKRNFSGKRWLSILESH